MQSPARCAPPPCFPPWLPPQGFGGSPWDRHGQNCGLREILDRASRRIVGCAVRARELAAWRSTWGTGGRSSATEPPVPLSSVHPLVVSKWFALQDTPDIPGNVANVQRLMSHPAFDMRAIPTRYRGCWLPLLSQHTEAAVVEGTLVVPLDCEWIWHYHRLNPDQYVKDCKRLYGRILGNNIVESSIQAKSKDQSAKVWTELLCPAEPFELECTGPSHGSVYASNEAVGTFFPIIWSQLLGDSLLSSTSLMEAVEMVGVELETVEILPGVMLEAMLQKLHLLAVQLPIRIRGFLCTVAFKD
ncbi:hypothetical protein ACQ4PT_026109 [Festuca glaucescens]